MDSNLVKSNDFKREVLTRKEDLMASIGRVVDSGWYILGNEVTSFESKFAEYLGAKHCVGVANGLEALQISLMALGIGPGDEVITTPLSAMATTLSIMAVGATPIFVDVDKRGQMDVSKIESKINQHTKAVLPVHLYGYSCYPSEIKDICKKYNLKYIEDACQAHGSKFDEKMLGTFGDVSCFSFYPTKNLGALGDGGAVVTDNEELFEKIRAMRDYGQVEKYKHQYFGLNSRLDEIQAAVLSVKLKYLDEDNLRRHKIASTYNSVLSGLKGVTILNEVAGEYSNYHQYPILVDNRDKLQVYLKDNGVQTLVHYPIALPDQPLFNGTYSNVDFPEVRSFVSRVLSLPIYPFLTDAEVEHVSKILVEYFT